MFLKICAHWALFKGGVVFILFCFEVSRLTGKSAERSRVWMLEACTVNESNTDTVHGGGRGWGQLFNHSSPAHEQP